MIDTTEHQTWLLVSNIYGCFIMLSTGNSVSNIYHQDRPENALIIFTFHPDGGQRAIIAFIYREGNYHVFYLQQKYWKLNLGLRPLTLFTVITVQLYHTPTALFMHFKKKITMGIVVWGVGGCCASSELSLSKKSHYNDEKILLTNLISWQSYNYFQNTELRC